MTPKVTLRQALEDPALLGSALAGPTWHPWRVILLAAMGEPLTKDELKTSSGSPRRLRCLELLSLCGPEESAPAAVQTNL